jgi:uncharacterized repeat protein (TIGR02543 family)
MSYSVHKLSRLAFLLLAVAISANAHTIKYILNGGVNDPDNPTSYVSEKSDLVLKDPTRDGFAFLGWFIVAADSVDFMDSKYFEYYQGKSKISISYYLGSFTVEAKWGLIPKTPKQDERGCYLIHDAEELYGIASVSTPNTSKYDRVRYFFDGCVSLQNDIVVNENVLDSTGKLSKDGYVSWIMLGFKGTFEGNGFKISGLVGEDGLFASLGGEEDYWRKNITYVQNLGLVDSYFYGATVGSIAGEVVGPVQMKNIYTDATVYAPEGKAGGLVGEINVTNDNCPTAAPATSDRKFASAEPDVDLSKIALVENAYSIGHVEGEYASGITPVMDAAILRNVYFAGTLKGEYTDCIVHTKGYTCYASQSVFNVENAVCLGKDTTVSKAKSLSSAQFADGTALEILAQGSNGSCWVQEIGTDATPLISSIPQFNIQYVLSGGVNNEQNPEHYAKGDAPFKLLDPQKEGDEFEGWFMDGMFTQKVDSVNTDLYGNWTFHAKWKSLFVINIDLNGGNRYKGNLQYEPLKIKWSADSATFVLEKAGRTGYEFDGWYTDTLFTNEITEIPAGNTEDVTVHAKWKLHEYTITYYTNGGVNDPDNPTTFNILDTGFVFKEPTREGAEFLHWSAGHFGYNRYTKIDEMKDLTLRAEWIPTPQEPKKDSKGCYLLTSKEELYWFADLVNVKEVYDACASLQNDIVVNETVPKKITDNLDSFVYFNWYRIHDFRGKFAGNGHSISGLIADDNCISETDLYGGLFCIVWEQKSVTGIKINNSFVEDYGYINNFFITGERHALPSIVAKSRWNIDVCGSDVTLSGLASGKMLLVMDVQGRILRKMKTQPSMVVNFTSKGKFLIRYGRETRMVTIR